LAVALSNRAKIEGDAQTALKVASLDFTTMGQNISMLSELDPANPVRFIKDLMHRKSRVQGTNKEIASARKDLSSSLKSEVKKRSPNKMDWSTFISSIQC
jgi:hypothetical protein